MVTLLIIFLISAFAILVLPKGLAKYRSLIIALLQVVTFSFFFLKIPQIKSGEILAVNLEWIPVLGINFEFLLDGLSLAFVILVTGVGTLVFLYAQAYMKSYEFTGKFFFYLTLFSGSMLGLVLSANMIQLFIFWELTSFLSFFLISFFHEKEASRKAAFQSLFITGLGGLSMLAGIIIIGSIAGSYSFTDWVNAADSIRAHSLYLPGFILILAGAFTKSAQFPFHFWLPGAMQAPTPVSSYLHSATMVKAGVFLLARLTPVLGGTTEWNYIIPLVGATTMLVGAYFAITQTDLKAILAYTTISALGILVLLLGIDTKLSVKAALVFLFVHAFYKATLFMVAGIIDKKTGTRDINVLGGLAKYMPVTFVVSILALLSMAGLPPMLGFLGKELIYEAKVQSPGIASLILVLGVTANIFMVAISLFFLYRVFLGPKGDYPKQPHEKGILLFIGPALLALLSLVFGLYPNLLGNAIVKPALDVVRVDNLDFKLKLWHGFNDVFFLSLFTILAGIILFLLVTFREQLLKSWRNLNTLLFRFQLTDIFDNSINDFVGFSKRYTMAIQHGYHRYYLLTILVFTSVLLWYQVYVTFGWEFTTPFSLRPFYISGLVLIVVLVSVYTIFSRSRIATIIAMGVAGYGLSLIYLYYSAVDLAITQILVETLTVVMFVLIMQKLPRFARLSRRRTKIRDLAIALLFGGVMTTLALKAINVEFHAPISKYFVENSYDKAYGKNIVNVILVDFRALDTLGEVTVLTLAALGVFILFTPKRKKV